MFFFRWKCSFVAHTSFTQFHVFTSKHFIHDHTWIALVSSHYFPILSSNILLWCTVCAFFLSAFSSSLKVMKKNAAILILPVRCNLWSFHLTNDYGVGSLFLWFFSFLSPLRHFMVGTFGSLINYKHDWWFWEVPGSIIKE